MKGKKRKQQIENCYKHVVYNRGSCFAEQVKLPGIESI